MCGLYGFVNYGNKIKNLQELTNSLAIEAASRGTDATGISFNNQNKLVTLKDSKAAYKMDFKHPDSVKVVIGHTRHSTQGSEKKNYNNHPFVGRCNNRRFALAHNGILSNDKELNLKFKFPKSKIETDSYAAVQLIEHKKIFNYDTIRFMAETVEGSFSFSILDNYDNLWLVKGDSPLSILHFPKLQLYVYASTDEILWKALIDTKIFDELKSGDFEEVKISCGEILNILSDGTLVRYEFKYTEQFYRYNWWDFGIRSGKSEYVDDLKSVAKYMGYNEEDIDGLIADGFTLDEIEEYLYY